MTTRYFGKSGSHGLPCRPDITLLAMAAMAAAVTTMFDPGAVARRRGLCRGRLADLDQVPVWVAQIAADLATAVLRRSEELRAPRTPRVVHSADVGHADVEG